MLVGVVGVALTTLLVFPLKEVTPVATLVVVYLVAVLVVSIGWGASLGILTALGAALAFNSFHIPSTGRFSIAGAENWVRLAVGEESEKVRALEAGADDYVTKPFGPRELVARLPAALRRAALELGEPVLRPEGVELDLAAHMVRLDCEEVHLTPIEFSLLCALMTNRGRLLTHRALLVEVWGRTHIANLRRKFERSGERRFIRTDPGVGYRFAL